MIPFGNHVVTLLHFNGAGYTCEVISGCSWRSRNERTLSDGATVITERTTCRIPPQHTCSIPGDLLILGGMESEANGEIELVRLMDSLREQGFKAFRVESCADNTLGAPIPHYAAIGA